MSRDDVFKRLLLATEFDRGEREAKKIFTSPDEVSIARGGRTLADILKADATVALLAGNVVPSAILDHKGLKDGIARSALNPVRDDLLLLRRLKAEATISVLAPRTNTSSLAIEPDLKTDKPTVEGGESLLFVDNGVATSL